METTADATTAEMPPTADATAAGTRRDLLQIQRLPKASLCLVSFVVRIAQGRAVVASGALETQAYGIHGGKPEKSL